MLNREEIEYSSIPIDIIGTDFLVGVVAFGEAEGRNCNRYLITVPNYTSAATTTLIVKNRRSKVTFTGAALAKGTHYSIPVSFDLHSGDQIFLQLSIAAAGAIPYTAYLSFHLVA